jgi:hypothetical protein
VQRLARENTKMKEPRDPSPAEDASVVHQRPRPAARVLVALCAVFAAASIGLRLTARRRRTAVVLIAEQADT